MDFSKHLGRPLTRGEEAWNRACLAEQFGLDADDETNLAEGTIIRL